MSLRQKALSGIKWTSLSSLVNTVLQLFQLSILTHYLSPSDFGLMAIVYVIIGFSALFMDMGISASIIHRQDLDRIELSSLYWLNLFAGLLLFVLVFLAAPWIAAFYKEPALTELVRLLAITFVTNSLGNQFKLLLQKELHFDLLARVSILTVATSLLLATLLAINGWGVYSLVYAALGSSLLNAAVFLAVGFRRHRPALIFRFSAIRPMLSFGMFQMADRSITYFNAQFDVILIGKLLGVEALGVYSVAKNLSMRPARVINPIITRVTFPVLAKIQDEPERLRRIYLKTIDYLSTVNFFIYLLMAMLAEPLITVLFGQKWERSVEILQILALYGAIRSTGNPQGTLLLSKGRADLGFYLNVGKFFVMTLVITAASHWGLTGVAVSLLFLTTVFIFPNWYFVVHPLSGAGGWEYLSRILRPLGINALGAVTAWAVCRMIGVTDPYLGGVVVIIVMTAVFIGLNLRYNREFLLTVGDLLGRRKR